MSTNSTLRGRLARLAPVRDMCHDRSYSAEAAPVLFIATAPIGQPISVFRRFFDAGLDARAAHAALNRLAAEGRVTCDIPIDVDIADLAAELRPLGVQLRRRRNVADPAAFILDIRTRHGLSQREFADALGLDVRTLQNWEQGRNRPDAAALSLMRLFDRAPELVEDAAFEPVA